MPISRANCLSAASFRPAGIHLSGAGHPSAGFLLPAGQTAGPPNALFADLLGEQKVRRLAGRDPPVWFFHKHGQTRHGSRITALDE